MGKQDHPRSRGVYISVHCARGIVRRIIPARAGFTEDDRHLLRYSADHPRSRGVYAATPRMAARMVGSSPLARGLLPRMNLNIVLLRIIPARAGFTCWFSTPISMSADHPRSRGVYSDVFHRRLEIQGSSPLARGLLIRDNYPYARIRIIPARAGFTDADIRRAYRGGDHPRSRGVYPCPSRAIGYARGSSPLARGLRQDSLSTIRMMRIIPARAGFTTPPPASLVAAEDHPRSRGVYSSPARRPLAWSGSSPLARGLPQGPGRDGGRSGIIPARAGFTEVKIDSGTPPAGSSPLARGLPFPYPTIPYSLGIIPARAGFTLRRCVADVTLMDHPRSRGVYDGAPG